MCALDAHRQLIEGHAHQILLEDGLLHVGPTLADIAVPVDFRADAVQPYDARTTCWVASRWAGEPSNLTMPPTWGGGRGGSNSTG